MLILEGDQRHSEVFGSAVQQIDVAAAPAHVNPHIAPWAQPSSARCCVNSANVRRIGVAAIPGGKKVWLLLNGSNAAEPRAAAIETAVRELLLIFPLTKMPSKFLKH
jgi:hypothetical protein